MTYEIYQELLKLRPDNTYISCRYRLCIALLLLTGVRISEILWIKVKQIHTLFKFEKQSYIVVDCKKLEKASHKAFLTPEGLKTLKERATDYEIVMKNKKDDEHFLFSTEKDPTKHISRETLTRDINDQLKIVSQKIDGNPVLTSHSFRIGYITNLWKDTGNLEFVRQQIGHAKISSTSRYV
jgi:site-specific recombinase XerD